MKTALLERTETAAAGDPQPTMQRLWTNPPWGYGVAVVVIGVGALLSAWLTPRGPLTTGQALVSMLGAAVVGAAVGVLVARRWAILATPLLYVLVFELARIGTAGPTVDAPDVASTLGWMALLVGRGLHGLLVLLPMVLATGYGVWLAHRLGNDAAPTPGLAGKGLLVVGTLAFGALAAMVARPASTAPIVGPDGEPVAGSIAELAAVEIGGVEQVMMIRGRSVDNPVLLHLSGGPGGTDIGAMRDDTSLEDHFVVVTWDQRGTGKSYATSIDPVDELSLERAITDTLDVTDYLRERFDRQKIYLEANSWGTIPSVFAVQRQPEKFHAYVGTGQMVNNRLTDQMFYEDALAWAEASGNDGLAERMRAAGPPPYEDLTNYEFTAGFEHEWNSYPGVGDLNEMPVNTMVAENAWMDRVNAARAMLDVNWFVYPEIQDYDFRRDAPRLDVPVYVVQGRYEARGRDVLARDWFEQLEAPHKELVVFEESGHRPSFEQPGDFTRLMVDTVLAQTARS